MYDTNFIPVDLINNVFFGEGVEIIDIKYDGESKSVGYFTNGKTAINIDKGILMTTGESIVASLPNTEDNKQTISSGNKYFDDDLSKAINSTALSDICRYEITFIPFSDSIKFNYVFASEEYPGFICSEYNDAFGFFISGENPDGGFYDNKNIALVPNSSEPVSINNIHPYKNEFCPAKNEQYYNSNPELSTTMTYNAYLDVFVASAKVVPCKEYKIKLVIADVVDDYYDSAVFLKAKSFSSNALKVSINTPSFDGTISEGCLPAELVFSFDKAVKTDFDLEMRLITDPALGNHATELIDYSQLPSGVRILTGQKSFSFSIQAYPDNFDEGEEIIALEYRKNQCRLDTLILKIVDNKLVGINLEDSVFVCENDTNNVGAKLPNDYVPVPDKYFYNNNDYPIGADKGSEVFSAINISGISPDALNKEMLKEICIDTLAARVISDLDIYVVTPDNYYFELSTDNGFKPNASIDIDSMINTCFTPSATTNINNGNPVIGDYFPLNPKFMGVFQPEGNWDDLWGHKVNGKWQLLVVNDETGWAGNLSAWHLAFNSNYKINFEWTPPNNISCTDCLSPDIYPKQPGYYYVDLKDTYGCVFSDSIYADIIELESVPFVNCDSVSTDLIRFIWGTNKQGEKYEIRINNTDPWISLQDTFYNVTGLDFNESVTFEVRIYSQDCINNAKTATCTTYPCPPPQIDLVSKFDVKCYGDQTGEIQVVATGSKGPYQYRYKNTVNFTGFFDNLPSGKDTIFVKDSSDCEIPYIFTIESAPEINVDINKQDISCNGAGDGSIVVSASGGNGGFQYSWKDSNGNNVIGDTLSGLSSSTYFLTVVDSEGCSYYDTVYIAEPFPLDISASLTNVECKGYNSGDILIDVTGGTGQYEFNWNTPVGNYTGEDLLNIPAGNYFLTVTDENNCEIKKTYVITEPANGLEIAYQAKDTLCYGEHDGWIALNIPENKHYSILWNNGDTRDSIFNLSKGYYEVTVTDSLGCVEIIKKNIVELDSVKIQIAFKEPSCYDLPDGEARIDKVFYGTRETSKNRFTFLWSTNPPQNGIYAYGLKGGRIYSVYAIDDFGCSENENIFIPNPEELKVKVNRIKDVSCYGFSDGRIEIYRNENDSIKYSWSSNVPVQNEGIADSLEAGIYKLTITDENGCTAVKFFNIKEPPPLKISYKIKEVSCKGGNDGEVDANIIGGTFPYIFIWEGKNSSTKIGSLSSGYYRYRIEDSNNCNIEDSIFVGEPAEFVSSSVETKDATCAGSSDGEIIFIDSGGIPPYAHQVLNGNFYSGDKLIGLESGVYTVITKDVNGCTDTLFDVKISAPLPLFVDIGDDTIVDYGALVKLNSVISNGIPPYTYTWIVPNGVEVSCTDCPDPEIKVLYDLQLQLGIKDSLGCNASDVKNILVKLDKGIFVPTAFTPNGNRQENKKLFVYGKSGTKIKRFTIYDRWGGKVYERDNFEINDESQGWDGTFRGQKLNSGVFSWYLEIENIDGTRQNFKGLVTLLR